MVSRHCARNDELRSTANGPSRRDSIASPSGPSQKTAGAKKNSCQPSDVDVTVASENDVQSSDFTALTKPLDEISSIVQSIHNSKCQIRSQQFQQIISCINEVKNKMINFLLPLAAQTTTTHQPSDQTNKATHKNQQALIENQKATYAEIAKEKKRPNPVKAAVIVKTESTNKVDHTVLTNMENSIIKTLKDNDVKATIHGAIPTKNGDILMMFDQEDEVGAIAEHIRNDLGVEAHERNLFLPKITITHIPEYISLDSSLEDTIVSSNEWMQEIIDKGEKLEVLFTYKAKSLGSAVCKVTPNMRDAIIQRHNRIKIGMRCCPVKDRIHVLQCGKCLSFGHKTNACKQDKYTCAWCAGDHKSSDCGQKDDPSNHKCANCSKIITGEAKVSHHNAFAKSCPCFKNQRNKVIRATKWGEGQIPDL